jgi:hypothetical protein
VSGMSPFLYTSTRFGYTTQADFHPAIVRID